MALGRSGRVDVDRHEGFGRIDNDAAARRQLYCVFESGLNLALNLVTTKQRDRVIVGLEFRRIVGHHLGDEGRGLGISCFAFNQYLAHI